MANEVDLGLRIFLDDMISNSLRGVISSMGMFSNQIGSLTNLQGSLSSSLDTLALKMVNTEMSLDRMAISGSALTPVYQDLQSKQANLVNQLALLDQEYAAGGLSIADYAARSKVLQTELGVVQKDAAAVDVQIGSLASQMATGQQSMVSMGQQSDMLAQQIDDAAAKSADLQAGIMGLAVAAGGAVDLLAFGAAIDYAVKSSASLQDALVSVKIALNATDQEMGVVGATVTQLADKSVFSTTQVADGFAMLAHRGYDAQQIVGGLGQQAIILAEAIQSDTVPAADLLASTMKVYGASADQAGQFTNALTFAYEHGIPSTSQLSTAISQVAGALQDTNVPLNELIPTLDYLAQHGLPNSTTAATSLRYMLQTLVKPTATANIELANMGIIVMNQTTPAFRSFEERLASTGKQAKNLVDNFDGTTNGLQTLYNEAKKLGVLNTDQTFQQWATNIGMVSNKLYDSNGKMLDLYSILKLLGDAIDKLPNPEAKAQALQSLFNVKSGQGADILLADISKVMPQLQSLTDQMNKYGGSGGAAKNAADRTTTLSGATKMLGTTFQSAFAQIGTAFTGPLTSLYTWLNNILSVTSKDGPKLTTFGSTFLTVGAILSGVAVVVGLAAAAFFLFDGALLPIIGIVLGVALGIALLSAVVAGAVVWFKSMVNDAANPLSWVFRDLQIQSKAFGDGLSKFLGPPAEDFKQLWRDLQPLIKQLTPLFQLLAVIIGGLLVGVFGGLMHALAPLINGLGKILAGVLQMIVGLVNIVVGGFKAFILVLVGIVQWITGTGNAAQTFGKAGAALMQAWGGVGQFFRGLWNLILGIFQGTIGTIAGFIMGFINGAISFFTHLYDTLVGHSIIPDLVKGILSWIGSLPGKAGALIMDFVNAIINGAKSLGGMFHDHVIQPLLDTINNLVKSALDLGGNIIKNLASGIINGIGNFLGNAMHSVGQFIHDHLPHSPAKRGPLTALHYQGSQIPAQIALGIHSNVGVLSGAATRMANVLTPTNFTHSSLAYSGAGGAGVGSSNNPTTTVNFVMDGKVMSSAVLDRVTGTLKMNGAGRSLK